MKLDAKLLFIGVAVSLAAAPTSAQSPYGRLLGVFDNATGRPVAGADVIDISTRTRTLTSDAGMITLAFLDPGTTVLQVRKVGYKDKMVPVMVSAADTGSVTVLLQPLAQTLPGVVTTAPQPAIGKLAEFERRRAAGFGHFLTPDSLDQYRNRQMSEVLRLLPSLHIVYTAGPARYVAGSRSAQGPGGMRPSRMPVNCLAAVMLDGTFIFQGNPGEEAFNVNSIDTSQIAGVEYYASAAEIPVEYNGTRAACGLLVLWSR